MYKVVDPLQPGTSTHYQTIDWSKCALCQEDTTEVLCCPVESRHGTQGAGYGTLANLVVSFRSITP